MGPRKIQWNDEKCIDNNLLVRYIERDTTPEETKRIREHLDECEICFRLVASMIRNERNPITGAEKEEVRKLSKLTPDEQVEKILSYQTMSKKRQEAQSQNWFVTWLSGFLKPTPRYAIAFVSVILILAISILTFKNFFGPDISTEFTFDSKVPYEYDVSALRGAQDVSPDDNLFGVFMIQFKAAMSAYVIRDYESTISTLEALEATATDLQARPDNKKYLPWIQNLDFYLGVSHLAQARSQTHELAEKVKAQHLEKSIQYLLQAKSLALDRSDEKYDRETYFLGLAYGFSGKNDLAVKQLKQIKPESNFYKNSEKLIQEWSNN